MMELFSVAPSGPVYGRIKPPGSKSISNRAIICAALAEGQSRLTGFLDSEDTAVMVTALRILGLDLQQDLSKCELVIEGCGGKIPAHKAKLFLENSGTSMRFLTALCSLGKGTFRLDGIERMRSRPIGDLLSGLQDLGVQVYAENNNGCPPVVVEASGIKGGTTAIKSSVSSQFLSGLLMAVPYAERDVLLKIDGELVSKPYVKMTLAVMDAFGISLNQKELKEFYIPAGRRYLGRDYAVEPDASAASYFWAAAAITGGEVTVEGLSAAALQGDVGFCRCLQMMGCEVNYASDSITVKGAARNGIDVDMNEISDTAQTLSAVALFVQGPTRIRGIAHNRHKESDRIGDLACELRKLGAAVEEHDDGLTIAPGKLKGAEIETYNDHRMAMSFAVVGLGVEGVKIRNPRCTEKTYPEFFKDLAKISHGVRNI